MSRGFRQIAFLMMFIFTASVQAWAFTVEDGTSHDGTTDSHLITQQLDNQQHDEPHDCGQIGHHYGHNVIDHLLGQVSGSFTLSRLSKESESFPAGLINTVFTYPEGIYRPPRLPFLT